jgi:hypothetical protein
MIICNIGYAGQPIRLRKGMLALTNHMVDLYLNQAFQKEIELCKAYHKHVTVIEPKRFLDLPLDDFSQTSLLIKQGEREGERALQKIKV